MQNYVKTEKCRVTKELSKLKEKVDRREWCAPNPYTLIHAADRKRISSRIHRRYGRKYRRDMGGFLHMR